MNIVVPIKFVPDLVEELVVDASGRALDPSCVRLQINEFDDHAVEQASLLKERGAAHLTIVAPDLEGVDDVLYTAAAKGADRLIKLTGDWDGVSNHALARALANTIATLRPDLILTGVQAHNDLDGAVGPRLAKQFGMPYVGYVACVTLTDGCASIRKEFPGGLSAEMQVTLPAVLGIQAAERAPRYIPLAKVQKAMKQVRIEEIPAAELEGASPLVHLSKHQTGARAEMVQGDVDAVADRLVTILKERGVI
ncbi:MAG: electron transfer flavoprotein subunit beta/FixA family protein [Chloroflexi bacterium]|nr:electron transfer flavoprotein subunit beta/FixA family protein [Chloroflexota bacterium]